MHDRLSPVLFAAVWTAQTTPPHSIHEPQSNVADNEYTDTENGGVTVYDEEEIVDVDHLLRRPPGQRESVVDCCVDRTALP